jgi:hypothetical protein
MFDYESGCLIAFLIFVYGNFNVLVQSNSRMEKNLNKVGMRLSWLTLSPKEMTSSTDNPTFTKKLFKFSIIVFVGLLFVLLSWLQVLLFIAGYLYKASKDAGAPSYVKEYRWKLKNVDMTFDVIAREMFKVAELQGSVVVTSVDEREKAILEFKQGIVNGMLNRGLLVQLMKIKPELKIALPDFNC